MPEPFDPETSSLSVGPELRERTETGFSPDLLRAVADLVLTTTYDGVWLIDAEARTTFVNQRMAQILGCTIEEMLGVPLFQFMDEEGRNITERNLERRRGGVEEQHEFKCLRKDGTPIWLLVTANPVYDRAGGYAGSLAMIADFSVQKARELALVAGTADLDRKLEELAAARSSIEALAYRDALTGLHNRRYFDDRIAQETDRCRRHARRLCLLSLDIDDFKSVNDRWGQSTGDEVLRGVGRALAGPRAGDERALLRSSDVAAR